MTMQRRHFELIAEVIREFDGPSELCRIQVAEEFARALGRVNPNFNRVRFLRACGVED